MNLLTLRESLLEFTDGNVLLTDEYLKRAANLDYDDVQASFKMIKTLKKYHPQSDFLDCKYAALLGDLAQFYDGKKSNDMTLEAVNILEELLHKSLNSRLSYYVKNEYFYHSGRFKEQFILGNRERIIMKTGKKGSFSSGVGASEHGFELLLRGNVKKARDFGKLSVWHWENSGRDLNLNMFYLQGLSLSGHSLKAKKLYNSQIKSYRYYKKQKVWFECREEQLDYISFCIPKID